MADLIPEGCVPLTAAFELFQQSLWNGQFPVMELWRREVWANLPPLPAARHGLALQAVADSELACFVEPFASGSLEALVRCPGSADNFTIPKAQWQNAFFAERVFLAPEVTTGHGDYWDALAGRTPFVRREQLEGWLSGYKTGGGNSPVLLLRDCLLGLAGDGALSSVEVEQLAREWGLEPFATKPELARFDPMAQASWSLAMSVAWISMRTANSVRDSWEPYRSECWEWFGRKSLLTTVTDPEAPTIKKLTTGIEVDGVELRALRAMSVLDLGMMEALHDVDTPPKVVSIKAARKDLWAELTEGRLAATGLDPGGNVVRIPAHEWSYLELAGDPDGTDYVIQRSSSLNAAYTELRFLRSDIVALWPPVQQPTAAPDEAPATTYDFDAREWSFLDAATWVGCEGQVMPNHVIAENDLDERGAEALFEALQHQDIVATGLNRQRIREPIPHVWWEMATTDATQFRKRHYVSFIDEVLEGYGGQLTPCGEDRPKWFGIRIERDALFAAFPQFAPRRIGTGGGETPTVRRARPPLHAADKLQSTRRAIVALFPGGFPPGLSGKDQLAQVNRWLRENGCSEVSVRTFQRAARPISD